MKCPRCNGKAVKSATGRGRCTMGCVPMTFNITPEIEAEHRESVIRAMQGDAHEIMQPAAPGFVVKGYSTLVRPDGSTAAQWIKTTRDQQLQALAIEAAAKAMGESIPRARPAKPPKATAAALLNCYVITDYHLGMLAWGEETGADWDTTIAEDMLVGWFAQAIAQSPAARVGVFAQLGDMLHFDSLDAVTPTSRHLLDADTRFQRLIRVAIRVVRRVIDMLLAKHEEVRVLWCEGNHDMATSAAFREFLRALYENEPRIRVDTRPDPYYCIEHGATALFFHHGHKKKLAQVDTVFAAKFREVFGRTRHAYAHMGHLHHVEVKETNLMVVEQHRTLAAPDAHASRGGWMSGRDAQVIVYHAEHGEVGRVRINSKMLEAA